MKFGVDLKTGKKQVITSWKGTKDPSTGSFTLELDPLNIPQAIIQNNSNHRRYWRSGPWNNKIFIGIPKMHSVYINGFSLLNQEETVYLTLANSEISVPGRWVLDSDGKFGERVWDETIKEWVMGWHSRATECDIYGMCGPFGSCNILNSPICSCLKGFEPRFNDEWSKGNWSGGCVRRTELWCERINKTSERNNNTGTNNVGEKADGFLKLEKMKVPDYVNWWEAHENVGECEHRCLNNCSCIAYSFDSNVGCMWWTGDLIDIQKFSEVGADLHIRVAYSDLDKKKDAKKIIIITSILGIVTICLFCSYFGWRCIAKQRGRKKKGRRISLFDRDDGYGDTSDPSMLGDNPELKIVNFETLAIATNNFSEANKLGHGGFGSVYKVAPIVQGKVFRWTRYSCEKAFQELWTRHTGV